MEAGIVLALFIAVALIATFVRRSIDEQVGFEDYKIKRGRFYSSRALKLSTSTLDFTVVFGKNCTQVRNELSIVYGHAFGLGDYNSISIAWKVDSHGKIGLYLRVVENGVSNYYSLCYVKNYEEIRVRVETMETEIIAKVSRRKLRQTYQTVPSHLPQSLFKRKIFPQLRKKQGFDVEIFIKENE